MMFLWLSALGFIGLPAIVLLAGQAGWLRGQPPLPLGVTDGRLAPPAPTPNSVSSQTQLYPGHQQARYAAMEPIALANHETGTAALARLDKLLQATPGVTVVERQPHYLRAEAQTRWLKFVDDVELLVDEPAGVIHLRSSSRLGRKDFGVNRARLEALRQQFVAGQP
jgi:uncharacterized protein (DUF1499 family)